MDSLFFEANAEMLQFKWVRVCYVVSGVFQMVTVVFINGCFVVARCLPRWVATVLQVDCSGIACGCCSVVARRLLWYFTRLLWCLKWMSQVFLIIITIMAAKRDFHILCRDQNNRNTI